MNIYRDTQEIFALIALVLLVSFTMPSMSIDQVEQTEATDSSSKGLTTHYSNIRLNKAGQLAYEGEVYDIESADRLVRRLKTSRHDLALSVDDSVTAGKIKEWKSILTMNNQFRIFESLN